MRWLTQLPLSLSGDVWSNPRTSQVCAMPSHVKIGTSVYVSNSNTNTNNSQHHHKHEELKQLAHTTQLDISTV